MLKTIRLLLLVLFCSAVAYAQPARVRISAWYWLNSAPRADWQGDFVTMHNLGFTDVVLCWGIDLPALRFKPRIADTREAMRLAHRAGLGAYLMVWQPTANSLRRNPEFEQVDSAGHHLFSFDAFNAEWRETQWKQYLQEVAGANRPCEDTFSTTLLQRDPSGVLTGRAGRGLFPMR
jgi:hypothetical protein